jgi:hypothetical protein
MPDNAKYLLDRALAAEEKAAELEEQIARLKALLGGALDMDPTTAIQALNWVGRAESAERLLQEAVQWERSALGGEDVTLPQSWWARVHATLKAVEVSQRDQPANAQRPADDTYFTQELDADRKPRALAPGSVGSQAARKIFADQQRRMRRL